MGGEEKEKREGRKGGLKIQPSISSACVGLNTAQLFRQFYRHRRAIHSQSALHSHCNPFTVTEELCCTHNNAHTTTCTSPVSESKLTVAWNLFPAFSTSRVRVTSGLFLFPWILFRAFSRFSQKLISWRAVPLEASLSRRVTCVHVRACACVCVCVWQ